MCPAGILARHPCSSIPTVAHEPRAEMVLLGLITHIQEVVGSQKSSRVD